MRGSDNPGTDNLPGDWREIKYSHYHPHFHKFDILGKKKKLQYFLCQKSFCT